MLPNILSRHIARRTTLLICLATLAFSLPAYSETAGTTRSKTNALDRGKILIKKVPVRGSDVPEVVVHAVVDAPPPEVWEVVSDCDQFAHRLPWVKHARQLKRVGNQVTCTTTVDMPFPFSDLTATTRATHEQKGGAFTRRWKLLKGDYHFNTGSWTVQPFGGDGSRSLLTYKLHVDPKTSVPRWLREKAERSVIPKLIEAVRKYARKLAREAREAAQKAHGGAQS